MNLSLEVSVPQANSRRVWLPGVASLWRRFGRQPLLHFLILGGLIFLVAHLSHGARVAAQRRIVVDEQIQHRLNEISRVQSGVTPGPQQLERLIQEYIDD